MSKLRSITIDPRCLTLCMAVGSPLNNLENELNKKHSKIEKVLVQPDDFEFLGDFDGWVPSSIRVMVFYTEESNEYIPFEFILWEKERWDNYTDNFGSQNDDSEYLENGCTNYLRGTHIGYFMTRRTK